MSGTAENKKIDCKSVIYGKTDSFINKFELDVPFVPTPLTVVNKMLSMADVQPSDRIYDLGCGDGRIVIVAAKNYGATAIGYDIDSDRINECRLNAQRAGISEKTSFFNNNIFDAPLADASVVTLYLLTNINIRLRSKLFTELQPGTRIVSHDFHMENWITDKRHSIDEHMIYLWIVPGNFSGTWQWEMADHDQTINCTLNIKQRFQHISAVFAGPEDFSVNSIALKGNQIELMFRINQKKIERHFHARGTLNSDSIQGTLSSNLHPQQQWIATRNPASIDIIF